MIFFHLSIHSIESDKNVDSYSKISIDDFMLIVVDPLQKLTDRKRETIKNYFGASSKDQSIEMTSERL